MNRLLNPTMDDDSRIVREFQRLSVVSPSSSKGHFDDDEVERLSTYSIRDPNPTRRSIPSTTNTNPSTRLIRAKTFDVSRNSATPYYSHSQNGRSSFHHQNQNHHHHHHHHSHYHPPSPAVPSPRTRYSHYIQSPISPHSNNTINSNNHHHHGIHGDGLSTNDIIHDLQRRKEKRLRNGDQMALNYTLSPTPKGRHSRFLMAAHSTPRSQESSAPHLELERFRQIVADKNKEIKSLRKELEDKEEFIKSLQYSLLQQNESTPQLITANDPRSDSDSDSAFGDFTNSNSLGPKPHHHRRRSTVVEETEKSAIHNVRKELRSGITKMASAQHEVARLLESVGDSSVIHDRLKKIEETLSMHKRKVSALEQTLNTDALNGGVDVINGHHSDDDGNEEEKDIGVLSMEYNKLRVEVAEMRQREKRWNETKEELVAVNKRCANLMKMLDRMNDDKLEMTLKIEDLQTLLNKHRIPYQM